MGVLLWKIFCYATFCSAPVFYFCMQSNIFYVKLYFSQICYTCDSIIQARVHAEVVNPEKGTQETTNTFHFTLRTLDNRPVPRVMPKTYAEGMLFLSGKRHYEESQKYRSQTKSKVQWMNEGHKSFKVVIFSDTQLLKKIFALQNFIWVILPNPTVTLPRVHPTIQFLLFIIHNAMIYKKLVDCISQRIKVF